MERPVIDLILSNLHSQTTGCVKQSSSPGSLDTGQSANKCFQSVFHTPAVVMLKEKRATRPTAELNVKAHVRK